MNYFFVYFIFWYYLIKLNETRKILMIKEKLFWIKVAYCAVTI